MKTINLSGIVLLSSFIVPTAFAADVVEIDGVQGAGSVPAGSTTLNKSVQDPDLALDTRYDTVVIERSVEDAREGMKTAFNLVKDMAHKKANPVRSALENFEVGAPKDLQDMAGMIVKALGADQALFEEQDKKAIAMLPINNTKYQMPAETTINVMGSSRIQAFPLKVGEETIGHFRVVCGGYDKEDVIINRQSVSYCVTSLIATGVSRNSGVHKDATTAVYYVGVSEPYVVGGNLSKVKINWATHPKSTTAGTLARYNLANVPHAVDTLDYRNNITTSQGEVLVGINARVSK